MDCNIKKDLENELQLIKSIIEGFRSFPNDTNEITPIIKYYYFIAFEKFFYYQL